LNAGIYATIDAPAPGYGTTPSSINASGQVVGTYNGDANSSCFLFNSGNFTPIAHPCAQPQSINTSGKIAGYYSTSYRVGFLYSGGNFTTIEPPGALDTYVAGMNDAGQIVGFYASDSSFRAKAFIYRGVNSYTTIEVPGNTSGTAGRGINASGQIVGAYITNYLHGFLYRDGVIIKFDVPNSLSTDPKSINNFGQIAGTYDDNNGYYGFLATRKFAGTPGKPNCFGQSVSALAQQYGGINTAANALGYGFSGVGSLQGDIHAYCGDKVAGP
jgi:probable HAF family extracellular repeat protein